MERNGTLKERLAPWLSRLSRYRFAALVALLGIGLMLLPGRSETGRSAAESAPAATDASVETADLCRQLEAVLSQMDGAGEVTCLVTYSEGARRIYQTDTVQSGSGEVKESTVRMSAGSGAETALTVGDIPPVVRGVVVLCDGADSARLRLEIVRAVSALTGLSSDKIAVAKRKGNS